MLLARITRRSAHGLGLHLGMAVYAQIKGVALIGDH
jgi:ABC-type molybdate transport system ATPase subunit